MRTAGHHILFLATEYDAPGMRPYARTIINTLWQEDDQVLFVSRYGTDEGAFPDIPAECLTWIDYPTGKLSKAVFRFQPTRVLNAIEDIVTRCNINLIFSLTEEIILADNIRRLQGKAPVLYTVHDAYFHDYKFISVARWLKDRLIIDRPQRMMLSRTRLQVTNSHEQRDDIIRRFPDHKVYYTPFPTLVNDAIAHGNSPVKELETVQDGYILFFGTMHLYKGVHLLYDAYLSHPDLQQLPLVIAGTKDVYFNRRPDEKNVFFINRYVEDDEVRDLFSRAAVVVYPYISATQSGVTSIASYFDKKMVLSDLTFFRQTCGGYEGVEFFPAGDSDALAAAITRSLQSTATTSGLYHEVYAPQAMRQAIGSVIDHLLG